MKKKSATKQVKTNWVMIQPYRNTTSTGIAVRYDKKNNHLWVKISPETFQHLNYNDKDRLAIFYDADNEKNLMIAKSTIGFKAVSTPSKGKSYYLRVSWQGKSILNTTRTIAAEHFVKNNQIYFTLPESM